MQGRQDQDFRLIQVSALRVGSVTPKWQCEKVGEVGPCILASSLAWPGTPGHHSGGVLITFVGLQRDGHIIVEVVSHGATVTSLVLKSDPYFCV